MKSQLQGLRFQLRGNGASTPLLPHNPNEERNLDPAGKNKKKTSSPVGTLLCALTAPLVLLSLAGSVILTSTTSDVHRLLRSLKTEWTLESTCKEHPAWENDIFWRTSTLNPIVCDPADDLANQTLARSRLGIEDLRDSLHLRNPCGSYCAFHTDSLAKRRRGPVTGWALKNPSNNGTQGCWNPIYDMKSDVCFQWFDGWKRWVVDNKYDVPEPPCPECDAERAYATQLISRTVARRCQHESCWKKNAFWRKSVEDPVLCQKPGVAPLPESLKLGEHDLAQSLATKTPCGSLCIFHGQSTPRQGVRGPNGTKIEKKGWKLVEINGNTKTKGCFEPIEDVRTSSCRLEYNSWALWMKTSQT